MPKAKFRSRAGKKGSGPVYTLKDAVRAMRKTIVAAKRHAKTIAAARIRVEFMDAMQAVMGRAILLHHSGRMDDEYLRSLADSAQLSFKTSQSCSYNVRRPGHALPGFTQFDLKDSENNPVNEGARGILEAGRRGYFDRLMGKDNPCAEDAAPDAAIRTAKQPPKGQRARKTRKKAAHA